MQLISIAFFTILSLVASVSAVCPDGWVGVGTSQVSQFLYAIMIL
jgi:hypothetical protein